MKKTNLDVSELKSEDGKLKGGFTSLTQKQMERINGSGNNRCTNEACGGDPGSNSSCSNMVVCNPHSNSSCNNRGDCGEYEDSIKPY